MVSTSNNSEEPNQSSAIDYRLLAPQALIGLADAMSYMVISPSIIFYVLQCGGNYSQYGYILAIFSFSSFCFKPLLGYWSDATQGKFRTPYLTSIFIAMLGGFIYFLAGQFYGPIAIALIFLGRFLGGAGAANSTLGFTYIASVLPPEQMTKASSLLSMVRILGMAVAPALNVLIQNVDIKIQIGTFKFHVDPLNSVGLFLVFSNLVGFVAIYALLEEPRPKRAHRRSTILSGERSACDYIKAIACLEIMVPLLSIFTLNVNFQLLETALAPAASDALGWGPVGSSALFASNAVFIMVAILITFRLSALGMSDETLLTIGSVFSIIGYSLMYFFWQRGTSVILFALPIVFGSQAFPFSGAPTRSIFTRVVNSKRMLRKYQGSMQALMSMLASVAGFVAPGLISQFVLRSPGEVDASKDKHELTIWALYAPAFSVATLLGVIYLRHVASPETEPSIDEMTGLVSEEDESNDLLAPTIQAARRNTISIMGIPQFAYPEIGSSSSRRHSTGIIGLESSIKAIEESGTRRKTFLF